MRYFTRSVPTARFPALPRRLSIMVMLTLMVSGLIIAPLIINEMLRTRMNEAVQQAIMLAQISHMHEFEGRRPESATQALPLVGFEIATAEASKPMLTWLDDLFVRLYGSTVMQAGDETLNKDLLRSLDRFQERLRAHVDEQARLASLGAGASFLAHDMRNLLASLQINAEQLEQMPGEKERRIGKRLSTAIEQALSLAEWATLYASHKRENLDVKREKLAPIVADALNFVRLHDPKREVDLVNECDPEAEIVAETTLLFRIIYNLVLNAVQSMKGLKSHKRITVEARSDETACTLYVSDTGPGMPNGGSGTLLMPHMSGFGRPDGTGLGLKIVVDLLSWHSGKIEVARADSHGTHFKITIPHDAKNAPRDQVLDETPSLDAPAVGG